MTEEVASAPATTEAPSTGGEVGSGGTQPEAAGQSTAQPEASQPESETTTKQPTDWRKLEGEDETLKEYVRQQIAAARTADRNKARREKARQALAATDQSQAAQAALEVAREVAEDQSPDEFRSAQFNAKRDKALPLVDRLTGTDEYAELWRKHGKSEMDRRFFRDPEEFADWAFEQVTEMRANKRADKRAMDLAKAMSAEQTADALRGIPSPLGGGTTAGGAGGMTLERLISLPAAESRAWKREHREEYDALVQALQ